MSPSTLPFLSIIALGALGSLQGQTSVGPEIAKNRDSYPEVKTLFEQYAFATDMLDDRVQSARDALVSLGPVAVQPLIRLFQESQSDKYRTSAITTLFSIDGACDRALALVQSELAKDPGKWHGKRWIFAAIMKTENLNPIQAVEFSTRALELGDDLLVTPQALVILERHGNVSNIFRLEAFLAERRRKLPHDRSKDELAISAQIAIDRIKQRAEDEDRALNSDTALTRRHHRSRQAEREKSSKDGERPSPRPEAAAHQDNLRAECAH